MGRLGAGPRSVVQPEKGCGSQVPTDGSSRRVKDQVPEILQSLDQELTADCHRSRNCPRSVGPPIFRENRKCRLGLAAT